MMWKGELLVVPEDLCWNMRGTFQEDRSQTVNVQFRGLQHLNNIAFKSFIHLHCKHPRRHKSMQLHDNI